MRTVVLVFIGFVVAGLLVVCSGYLGKRKMPGAVVFIAGWLIFCAIDYSNGVKAGFPAIEEAAIHTVLFTIPAIGAYLAARYKAARY